ncbi:MAG: hypothetical protein KatS3mg060_2799 [Dehalococcoidia bacterium]|nr:MAG: hypothetical protein KatS3mg060_2799 [Dehalococcoidia bacterium]
MDWLRSDRHAVPLKGFFVRSRLLPRTGVAVAVLASVLGAPLMGYAEGPTGPRVFIPVAATEADTSGGSGSQLATPPSIAIVAPSAGTTLRGIFQVRAKASGISHAVAKVDNGSPVTLNYDRGSGDWVGTIDSRNFPSGRHTLTVVGEGRRRSTVEATITDIQFDNALATPTPSSKPAAPPTQSPTPTATPSGVGSPPPPADGGVVAQIFDDSLAPAWENWSWDGTARFDTSDPVFRGSRAISFLNFAGYAGLDLHRETPIDVAKATHLRFAARAGARDQRFRVALVDGAGNQLPKMANLVDFGGDPIVEGWRVYQIPLSAFGASVQQVKSVFFQDISGRAQPSFHVDEIAFASSTVAATNPTPSPAAGLAPWNPSPGQKHYGINLTGAEYTPRSLPGVLGKDYVYPYSGVTTSLYPSGYQGLSYFRSKGLRLVRLPVRWERVQPVAFGPLSEADVAGIRRVLDEAASRQQQVIVELHNSDGYYGVKLSAGQAGQFADVWQKLAGVLVGHPGLYGYELLNEPAELVGGSGTWKVLAQAGLEGIRRVDRSAWVLIPGYQWQKASTWRTYNEDLLLTDPSGKLLYAAHIYFDWDATGFHRYSYDAGGAYPMIGVDRVRGYLEWLAEHRVQGIITEYGVVDHDPRWLTVLENFLRVVDSDPWVVGAVAWAAGPLWGTPRDLGLDPLNGKDQPQMQVIAKFPSR